MLKAIIPCLSLLFLLSPRVFADLTLVDNGQSPYCIVVAKDALRTTVLAARELQKYLYRATDVELSIVAEPGDKPAIFIGAEQIETPEGYAIRTAGQNLYISGNDTQGDPYSNHWRSAPRTGTWYGVANFLQQHLGISWFFPGDLGEYVPKTAKLVIPALDYRGAPKMIHRRLHYVAKHDVMSKEQLQEVLCWLRRNGNGFSRIWSGSHSWKSYFSAQDYFAEHPEWFAVVNGRRLAAESQGHGLQMCTTNPQALDKFAETIIEYGKKNPGVMFSLSPNDGGNHCECANCTALDNGLRADGSRIMTDRYVTYCNAIAERVCKVNPEQLFGFYAYSFYSEPPSPGLEVHPNVKIMNVHNGVGLSYYVKTAREEHLRQELLPWSKKVNELYFYGTPEGFGSLSLPAFNQRGIKYLYENLRQAKVVGFDMCNSSCFASTGLNNYLYAKMSWDPDADCDALYEQALQGCYGPAASQVVREYFAEVENRLSKYANGGYEYNRAVGAIKRFPGILETVYPKLPEQWLEPLRQARERTADPGQKARINLLVQNLEYCQTTLELYQLSKKIIGNSNPAGKDVAKALQLCQQWYKQLEGMSGSPNNVTPAAIKNLASKSHLPFDSKVYQYFLSAQERQTGSAQRVKQPPLLDGQLEVEFWGHLPEFLINREKDSAAVVEEAALAKIAVDEEYLYIGVHCPDKDFAKSIDSLQEDGSPVWDENCVDIFFDPEAKGSSYRQLIVNTLGAMAHPNWEPQAEAKTYRGKDFWSLEIRLPLSSLTTKQDLRGCIWGFNICRVKRTVVPSIYSCWSPTFGNFGQPDRFGRLIIR